MSELTLSIPTPTLTVSIPTPTLTVSIPTVSIPTRSPSQTRPASAPSGPGTIDGTARSAHGPSGNSGADVSDDAVVASLVAMTLIDLPTAAPSTAGEPVVDEAAPIVAPADAADDGPAGTSYARCADGNGTLTHLFFSDDEFDIARAKAICGRCGLAQQCLGGALDRAEAYGVWGGQLVVDGVVVAIKRGRGRPPKTPRPPLVVDEVPVPPHLVA